MAEKTDGKKSSPHAGHRERMRNEFLHTGGGGMEDHRLLELLLFYTTPRGDVIPWPTGWWMSSGRCLGCSTQPTTSW